MSDNSEYIVDVIFPADELHLLVGPSGAGKSTWLYEFIKEWGASKPICGYASHPKPWMLISCDRSRKSMCRTMDRIGSTIDRKRMLSLVDIGTVNLVTIEDYIKKYLPKGGVLFIEGFAALLEGKEHRHTVQLCIRTTQICQKYHVTVIGSIHSPKAKPGEQYSNPRDRISGSNAFAGFSDTIVLIELPDGKDDGTRQMLILSRNAAPIEQGLEFNDVGLLVEQTSGTAGELLDRHFIKTAKAGDIVYTQEVLMYSQMHDISTSTAKRWLREKKASGELKPMDKGSYTVAALQ